MKKHISILGASGSIGTQTLDVVRHFPDQFEVVGLTVWSNEAYLRKAILEFKPKIVGIGPSISAVSLSEFLKQNQIDCEIVTGDAGLVTVATHPRNQLLIVAIVGTASLKPTYEAINKGIAIGLACKEVLVAAGQSIMRLAKEKKVAMLPIDSEHAALKQCLSPIHEDIDLLADVTLTASGGPFLNRSFDSFSSITPEEALKHPNWSMGAKITIDSATLMNKGFEVLEAHHLFDIPFSQIHVAVHPQSIVHSFATFKDGNSVAHLGMPDMRIPIQYVLFYPDKIAAPWPRLSLSKMQNLQFLEPDFKKFPLLRLAYETGEAGGTAPAVMNAANEAAVALFLAQKIGFLDIFKLIHDEVESFSHLTNPSIEDVIVLDREIKSKLTYDYAR